MRMIHLLSAHTQSGNTCELLSPWASEFLAKLTEYHLTPNAYQIFAARNLPQHIIWFPTLQQVFKD